MNNEQNANLSTTQIFSLSRSGSGSDAEPFAYSTMPKAGLPEGRSIFAHNYEIPVDDAQDAYESFVQGFSNEQPRKRTFLATYVDKTIPELRETMRNINEAAESTKLLHQPFDRFLRKATDFTTTCTAEISTLVGSITAYINNIPSLTQWISKAIDFTLLLTDLIIMFSTATWNHVITWILRFINLLSLPEFLFKKILSTIMSISKETPVETQEGAVMNANGAFDILASTVSLAVGGAVLGREPSKPELQMMNEKMRFVDNVNRVSRNIKDFIISIVQSLPTCIQNWMKLCMPLTFWTELFAPNSKYAEWLNEVDALSNFKTKELAGYHYPTQQRIEAAYATGRDLITNYALYAPRASAVFPLMKSTLDKLDELHRLVDFSSVQRHARPVPFCIYLHGPPGIGKSFLTAVIAQILTGTPNSSPAVDNLIYQRNPSIAHWDGYSSQPVVILDDFGALRDSNVSPGEAAEMIAMVSNTPYRIPFANLNDKGGVFRSQILLITSNQAYPVFNSIATPSAIYRRRHAMYEVSISQDFYDSQSGQIRVDKLQRSDGKHLFFQKQTPLPKSSGQVNVGVKMTIDEFLRDIVTGFAQHRECERIAIDNRARLVDTFLSVRQDLIESGVEMFKHDDGFYSLKDQTGVEILHQMEVEGVDIDIMRDTEVKMKANGDDQTPFFARSLPKEQEKPKLYDAVMRICERAQTSCEAERFLTALRLLLEEEEKIFRSKAWVNAVCLMVPVLAMVSLYFGIKYFKKKKELKRNIEMEGDWNGMMQRVDPEGWWQQLKPEDRVKMIEVFLLQLRALDPKAKNFMVDTWERLTPEEKAVQTEVMRNGLRCYPPEVYEAAAARMFGKNHEMYQLLMANGAYANLKDHRVPKPKIPVKYTPVLMKPNSFADQNAQELINRRVIPGLVFTRCGVTKMNGFMIGGRWMVTAKHLFRKIFADGSLIEDGTPFTIEYYGVVFHDIFEKKRMISLDHDLCAYEMGLNSRTWKDIRHLFLTEQDFNGRDKVDGLMVFVNEQSQCCIQATPVWKNVRVRYPVGSTMEYVKEMQGWQVEKAPLGICGSPLIAIDNFYPRKILGIHVACNQGTGLYLPITQEQLMKIPMRNDFGLPVPEHILSQPSEMSMIPNGNFSILGKSSIRVYQPEKTKLRKSKLYGKVAKVTKGPSVLSPRDERNQSGESPLLKGISKYGRPAPVLKEEHLKRITKHLVNIFGAMPNDLRRQLTEEEAINGLPIEYFDPLVMDTSPGFPYVQTIQKPVGKSGKEHLFSEEQPRKVINKDLRDKLDLRRNMARRGYRSISVWCDTLKDEPRALEKIETGSTRVFTVPPVDYSILSREMNLAFVAMLMKNRLKCFSAVGINPQSLEWTMLMTHLQQVSEVGFAGDYSGWDGNLSPAIIMAVCDVINAWYDDGDEAAMVRRVLFDELVHTNQIAIDVVYQSHIGNPSGNPLTTVLNTIANYYYLCYAFLELAPVEMNDPIFFDQYVRVFIYGDDNIMAVHPEVVNFFFPANVSRILKEMNMTYTAADKKGDSVMEPIVELTFLKSGFRKLGSFWVPTLDTATIENMVMWYRESSFETEEELTISNINESLRAASLYGKKFFDKWRVKIIRNVPGSWVSKIFSYDYFMLFFREKFYPMTTERNYVEMHANSKITTEQEAQGVIAQAQRGQAVTSMGSNNPVRMTQMIIGASSDKDWTLSDVTNKRAFIGVVPLTVSNVPFDILHSMELPVDALVNAFQTTPFTHFTYWNGGIKIIYKLNATRFYAGQVGATFFPMVTKSDLIPCYFTQKWWPTIQVNPTAYMDVPTGNEMAINVPFTNIKPLLNLKNLGTGLTHYWKDYIGTIALYVYSPLKSSDTMPPQVDISVWVEFDDQSAFRIPRPYNQISFFNEETARHYYDQGKKLKGEFTLMRPNGNSTSINNVTTYGNVDNMAMPTEITSDGFKASATIPMTMDKPARTVNGFPIERQAFSYFSQTTGSAMFNRLDLNPSNQNLSFPELFATDTDEMDLSYLFQRMGRFASYVVDGSTTSGTLICSHWLGPWMSMIPQGVNAYPPRGANTLQPTTCWEYAVRPFRFWRGGIKLHFDFITTPMLTARFLFCVNYNVPPATALTMAEGLAYGVIIDIGNENHTFDYTVPYNNQNMWTTQYGGQEFSEFYPSLAFYTNTGQPTIGRENPLDYFMGSFRLYLLNREVTPSNAPASIDVIISVSGAEDFKVYYPSATGISIPTNVVLTATTPPEPFVEMQLNATIASEADAVPVPTQDEISSVKDSIVVTPGGQENKGEHPKHFGANAPVTHLKRYITRFCGVNSLNTTRSYPYFKIGKLTDPSNDKPYGFTLLQGSQMGTTPAGRNNIYLAYVAEPVMPIPYFTSPPASDFAISEVVGPQHPLSHFAPMYRYWRGTMRYNMISGTVRRSNGQAADVQKYGAFFFPHPFYSSQYASDTLHYYTRPNFAGVAALNVSALENVSIEQEQDIQSMNSFVPPLAGAMCYDGTPYVQIEIPFTSQYASLLNYANLNVYQTNAAHVMTGWVFFYCIFGAPSDTETVTSLVENGISWDLTIQKAAGDDFRFGGLYHVPYMRFAPGMQQGGSHYPMFPDWFQITDTRKREIQQQKERKKKVVVDSSDDDFVDMKMNGNVYSWYFANDDQDYINLVKHQFKDKGAMLVKEVMLQAGNEPNIDKRFEIFTSKLEMSVSYNIGRRNRFGERNQEGNFYWEILLPEARLIQSGVHSFDIEKNVDEQIQARIAILDHLTAACKKLLVDQLEKEVSVEMKANGDFKDPLPCTEESFHLVVPEIFSRFKRGDVNGRAALNEMTQKIVSVRVQYDDITLGEQHQRRFLGKCLLSCNLRKYDVQGSGEAGTKKMAHEEAARKVFNELYMRVKEEIDAQNPEPIGTLKKTLLAEKWKQQYADNVAKQLNAVFREEPNIRSKRFRSYLERCLALCDALFTVECIELGSHAMYEFSINTTVENMRITLAYKLYRVPPSVALERNVSQSFIWTFFAEFASDMTIYARDNVQAKVAAVLATPSFSGKRTEEDDAEVFRLDKP